jgi:hypothetical protein
MAEVKSVTVQLRRPLGAEDAGMVARGYYTFLDGVATLVDEKGTPLRRGKSEVLTTRTATGARDAPLWSAAVLAGHDAHRVAARLLHSKVSSEKSGSDFNRPLNYPPAWVV